MNDDEKTRGLAAVPDLPVPAVPAVVELHVTVRPEQWDRARDALMYWQVRAERPGHIWTVGINKRDAKDALSIAGIHDAWLRPAGMVIA
jgi:hypothetical protein